jgi:hypothetical protein
MQSPIFVNLFLLNSYYIVHVQDLGNNILLNAIKGENSLIFNGFSLSRKGFSLNYLLICFLHFFFFKKK